MDEVAISIRRHDHNHDDVTVLGVIGPIVRGTVPALHDHLRALIRGHQPARRLLLDLSCCTDVDVDGLLALAVSQDAARAGGGDLRLVQVPPLAERRIRQHNFDELLNTDEGEAARNPG